MVFARNFLHLIAVAKMPRQTRAFDSYHADFMVDRVFVVLLVF